MPLQQYINSLIGQPVGVSLVNSQGTSGVLCNVDGKQLDFRTMLVREFIGKVGLGMLTLGAAYVISIFMVIFRKDKRAIHDFVAKTAVVYKGIDGNLIRSEKLKKSS